MLRTYLHVYPGGRVEVRVSPAAVFWSGEGGRPAPRGTEGHEEEATRGREEGGVWRRREIRTQLTEEPGQLYIHTV